MTLPDLFSTSMDSGDLDNDGDIDFIINGQDANNNWKKYIYKREGSQLNLEEDYNGQFNGDQGYANGVVRMADSGNDGDVDIYMMGNDDSRIKMNTYINESNENDWWNYHLPNLQNASMVTFGDYIYYMGQDDLYYQPPQDHDQHLRNFVRWMLVGMAVFVIIVVFKNFQH